MSVTVVGVLYGVDFDQFEDEWRESIRAMRPRPDDVLLHRGSRLPDEKYPQARLLNEAILAVRTEWVWALNVDDLALPDALEGLQWQASDVWLMGFRRHDIDVPPELLSNDEYLASHGNPYPSMSAFRKKAWETVGGYPLIGNEDWGLWRRMARAGFTFSSSGRVHCIYRDHPLQRTKTDVTPALWAAHREEMLEQELSDAVSV